MSERTCLECGEVFGEQRHSDGHKCSAGSQERFGHDWLPGSSSGTVKKDGPGRKVQVTIKDGRLQLKAAFHCDRCGLAFWKSSDLERHTAIGYIDWRTRENPTEEPCQEKMVEDEGLFECEICGDVFGDPVEYRDHIMKEHVEPSEHSNRAISDNLLEALESGKEAELRPYNREVSGSAVPLYACSICSANFSEKANLFDHTARVHHKRVLYECTLCERTFVQRPALTRHIQGHVSFNSVATTGGGNFECHFCGKRFPFDSYLRRHVATHTEECYYTCELCGNQFRTQRTLVLHKAKHTGDRLHPCPKCGKVFPYRSSLERHYKTHVSVPSQCPHCDKMFTIPGQLQKHVDLEHTQSPTLLVCPHCPRKFMYPSYLERHLAMHLPTKGHECPICSRQFSVRGALLAHLHRHLPNSARRRNPYKCKLCDQTYRHESTLEKHMERVHGRGSGVGMAEKSIGETGTEDSRECHDGTRIQIGQVEEPIAGTVTGIFVD